MSEEIKVETGVAEGKWRVAEYVGGVCVPLYEGPAELAGEKYDEKCKNLTAGTVTLTDPDGNIREQKVRAAFRPHVGDEGKIEYADVDEPFRPEPIRPGQGGIVRTYLGSKRDSTSEAEETAQDASTLQAASAVQQDEGARLTSEERPLESAPSGKAPALEVPSNSSLVTIEQLDVTIGRLRVVLEVLESRRRMFSARVAAHNDIGSVRETLDWASRAMRSVAP